MEKKEDLIRIVEESGADDNLKKMVVSFINRAYDAGFAEGLTRGAELQSKVFDSLFSIK